MLNISEGTIMRQVVLIPDKEVGGFTVIVPTLPGCISEGDTIDEAIVNIREAMELHIESMIAQGEEVPEDALEPLLKQ
jgi:antitoxin HicB